MKLIPKLQTAWSTIKQDNTRVQRPLILQPIKRKLKSGEQFFNNNGRIIVAKPKEEYIQQDNRDVKQREDSHKQSVQTRKKEQLKKAEQHTTQVFGKLLDEATLVPTFERITGEELSPAGKFAASFVLPTVALKGAQYVGKGLNYAGKAANYAARMGMPALGYTPTTQYYFKPGYAGINFTPVEKLFEVNRWNRLRNPKYVTEQDKRILSEHMPEYKLIQEKALDEGTYMQTPKNFPGSKINKNGEYIFQGDEGSWIQSQSKDFKAKFGDKTLKIGYKGGTDQKAIEGGVQEHAPETFPEQDKGIFFAADKRYADKYNHGNGETPGFWLGFSKPYDMLEGGQRPFLLESEAIRYMRSIDATPSFKGFPDRPFEILGNIWGDLSYLKDPKIMSIITKDPNKMTAAELAERVKILSKIRAGQNNNDVKKFGRMVDVNVKSGRWQPLRSTHYDGYIGRDHSLRWSPEYDPMEPFGSHPESYVITKPEQASILVGNNGSFNGPAYSRKHGGKLKFKIK